MSFDVGSLGSLSDVPLQAPPQDSDQESSVHSLALNPSPTDMENLPSPTDAEDPPSPTDVEFPVHTPTLNHSLDTERSLPAGSDEEGLCSLHSIVCSHDSPCAMPATDTSDDHLCTITVSPNHAPDPSSDPTGIHNGPTGGPLDT